MSPKLNQMPPTGDALAEVAELYTRHGMPVIRLHYPTAGGACSCGKEACWKGERPSTGKHPDMGTAWQTKATTDPDAARTLFAGRAHANVGVVCRHASGLVMIDVDSGYGYELVGKLFGNLPPTPAFRTGRGVRYIFRNTSGVKLAERSEKNCHPVTGEELPTEAFGVLVGDGVQTVMPPSLHYLGTRYEWLPGRSLEDLPIADAPAELVEYAAAEKEAEQVPAGGGSNDDADSPMADFNRRCDWRDLYEAAGWKLCHKRADGVAYLTRPGKDGGVSGTLGFAKAGDGGPALCSFSGSVTYLTPRKAVDKFGFYFRWKQLTPSDAAKQLRDVGFNGVRYGKPVVEARFTGGTSANGTHNGHQRNGKYEPPPESITRFVPELLCASDIPPERVAWLLHGRIPLGRGTLVAGRGGLGKTLLLCDMAATVSRGRYWPDGHKCPKGDVLFLSAEDDPADTLVPRAMAAGADLTRIHFLRGAVAEVEGEGGKKKVRKSIDLKAGMDIIAEAVEKFPDLKLVIIDPIGSYLGRGTDSHRDNEVREALDGIARLAAERGFAVVFIAHVNKSSMNAFADDAILGSRAFSTFCRATHHLLADPDDKTRRLLMPGKCNLAMTPAGLAYTIEQVDVPGAGEQPRVCWSPDPVEGDANDFIGLGGTGRRTPGEGGGGRNAGERREAGEFLRTLLADGPVLVKEIRREVNDAALSWATVRRAKDENGITSKKRRGSVKKGEDLPWYWGVGDEWEPPAAEGAHLHEQGDGPLISQASEHLRGEAAEKPAETPDFPEGAHAQEPSEHLRDGEHLCPEGAHEGAHPDAESRRCSHPPETEHLRKTEGETATPAEGAHFTCEIGATPKRTRRKKDKPTTAPDPLTDTDTLIATVCKAGWTATQAVEWLEAQDEFVPGSDLAGTHGGQRRKLLDHLATITGREVSA